MKSRALNHIYAILTLLVINAIYFFPAYQGKILEQDDIMLGVAKSKEIREYREKTGEEALWTNAMFSGMPTFQINLRHPGNILEKIEPMTKLWQPNQIGLILFLMIGMYLLLVSYKVDPWLSVLGGVAFGFSAFFIISFDAGHNAKIRAAGYMAPMLMGILLCLRGKWWLGVSLSALFGGLAISANHFQITYYSVLIVGIILLVELVNAFRTKRLQNFGKSIGLLLIAGLLAIGPNVSKLWTTYEYSKSTIRGGSTELSPEKNDGLDKDYAFSWSYGPTETLNLLIPNLMGGGASQSYEETQVYRQYYPGIRSSLIQQGYGSVQADKQAQSQISSLFYWGEQSMVNGAYYIGASLFFFFVLGIFLVKDKRRIWILVSILLAIVMAWGKHFSAINDLLFDYLPLYNKFRVPSMTLVILFLLVPFLAILGLNELVQGRESRKDEIRKALMKTLYVCGGLFLFMVLFGTLLLDYEGPNDQRLGQNPQLLDLLIEDRKDLARSSSLRSLILALLAFGLSYVFLLGRINKPVLVLSLGVMLLFDLWSFDRQHLNNDDWETTNRYEASFSMSKADRSILSDQGYYRVFNLNNPFNDALTSYYHKAIGGYHGAKLQRYQELYENVIFNEQNAIIDALRNASQSDPREVFTQTPVLNMLNAKYVIYNPQSAALQNFSANGVGWFIQEIKVLGSSRKIVNELAKMNSRSTVLIHEKDLRTDIELSYSGQGTIALEKYEPNEISYSSSSREEQFAVFSEIYYRGKEGDWQAYIDGERVEHIRANYVLRGLKVPPGDHQIRFEFRPMAYYTGNQISMIASILLLLLIGVSVYMNHKKNEEEVSA